MNARRAVGGLALAAVASQAGHLIAYQARFGAAAQHLQSSGAHAYFPTLARTFAGAAALAVLASLCLVGLARALGREERHKAPPFAGTVAVLFTLQLGLFLVQELVEARVAGLSAGSGVELLMWGTIGQLPAAAAAALALRWLVSRVVPAARVLGEVARLAAPVPAPATVLRLDAVTDAAPANIACVSVSPLTRRGPPISCLLRTGAL